MGFSGKKTLCYFLNLFYYFLLIEYIKTLMGLKCQQFKDNKSDKTESSISKRQQLDIYKNEKKQDLDKYDGQDKSK